MNKKNLKRFAALSLATAMTVGSGMTVLADGVAEGTGKYEGKDGEKPVVSITLPTDTELANIYNYIADPNDLINTAKDKGSLGSSATIENSKGILFQTDTDKYSGTSKKLEVTSENLQDVDVTVEVKVKDDAKGDKDIVYVNTDTFDADDTGKKLYLAITDAAATDPKVAALPSAGVVKLTQTADGKTDNYELTYDQTNSKYVYTQKTGATGWNKVGFALTGAINTKADWGESVALPTLQVTWSYKEHKDSALSSTTISATANTITVEDGITVTGVALVKKGTTSELAVASNLYTFAGGKLTVTASMLNNNIGGTLKVKLSNGTTEDVAIQ